MLAFLRTCATSYAQSPWYAKRPSHRRAEPCDMVGAPPHIEPGWIEEQHMSPSRRNVSHSSPRWAGARWSLKHPIVGLSDAGTYKMHVLAKPKLVTQVKICVSTSAGSSTTPTSICSVTDAELRAPTSNAVRRHRIQLWLLELCWELALRMS